MITSQLIYTFLLMDVEHLRSVLLFCNARVEIEFVHELYSVYLRIDASSKLLLVVLDFREYRLSFLASVLSNQI